MVEHRESRPKIPRGRPRKQPGAPVRRRPCEQIRKSDAFNLSKALHHARNFPGPGAPGAWDETLNFEPNAHVIVQWCLSTGEVVTDGAERTQRLIETMSRWLRRKANVPAVWAYAREVSLQKGEHLHLIVHVPPRHLAPFTRMIEAHVGPRFDPVGRGKPVVVKPIEPGGLVKGRGVRSYLLKEGGEELVALGFVHEAHFKKATGGVIQGKRLKVSRNIDRMARTASEMAREAP